MQTRFVNRLLNVSAQEWPRILLAWHLNLFLRIGFVMGWTVTVAMFINRIGIEALPYLFVLNALMIMVGSLLYSYLLQKINRQLLMVYTVLMGGALLLLATMFSFTSSLMFFGLILVAQSVMLSQLNILIALFTEDLFSPLESQRTFPLIATSETIGGILGGLAIGLLSGVLVSYKFIYLWILATLMLIPILMTSRVYNKRITFNKLRPHSTERHRFHIGTDIATKLRIVFRKIKQTPLLQGMVVLVMFQFMLFTLVEFQYTKAVQFSILAKDQSAIEISSYRPETALQVSLLSITPRPVETPMDPHSMAIENELTKNLGMLMMIFSIGSLIVQIFIASRLLGSIGIVGTFLIHPLVTLLNLAGTMITFNFFTAALMRSNFEITGKLFQNAYHSSYYAIAESIRDYIKEFIDGFIKPIGTIFAFVIILAIQSMAAGSQESLLINIIMIGIVLAMAIRLLPLKQDYTEVCYRNLDRGGDLATRLNAIEILSQKGHRLKPEKLLAILGNKQEKKIVKLKIIEALKEIKNPKSIPALIDGLKNEHPEIRRATLEALGEFEELKRSGDDHYVFTRHRAVQSAKTLFQHEESSEIRAEIIQLLAKIDHKDLIPFIIQTLEGDDAKIKRACIRACRQFGDQSLSHYLKEYLNHKDAHVRAEAIAALWPFEEMRSRLKHYLNQMKKNPRKEGILAMLYLLGEVREENSYPYIFKQLSSFDRDIAREAAKTLGKLNHRAGVLHLADAWIENPAAIKKFMPQLTPSMRDSVEQLVHRKISHHINGILEKADAKSLEDMDESTLLELQKAYEAVEEYDEAFTIETLIASKNKTLLIPHHAVAS